jgi:hypothetical protein
MALTALVDSDSAIGAMSGSHPADDRQGIEADLSGIRTLGYQDPRPCISVPKSERGEVTSERGVVAVHRCVDERLHDHVGPQCREFARP